MLESERENSLFYRYLDVCNKAMDKNQEIFPYKQLWDVVQKVIGKKIVSFTLYDDVPKEVYDVILKGTHIEVVNHFAVLKGKEPRGWRVNKAYLEKVVKNPQDYINNPARLDWDWLKDRLHLRSS